MSENPRYGASSQRGGTCVHWRGQCGRGSVPWRCRKEGRTAAKDGQVRRQGLHERRTEERPDSVGSCFRVDWHDVHAQCVVNTGAGSRAERQAMPTRATVPTRTAVPTRAMRRRGGSESRTRGNRCSARRHLLTHFRVSSTRCQPTSSIATIRFSDSRSRTQRDGVVAELDRVKKEVAAQTKAISDIQEEARRANVPAGWVR